MPRVWFFSSPRLRIFCRKRSRFSGRTLTTTCPRNFPFACFSEFVVATYPRSSLANAVSFWTALSKLRISSSTVALRISLRLANPGADVSTGLVAASFPTAAFSGTASAATPPVSDCAVLAGATVAAATLPSSRNFDLVAGGGAGASSARSCGRRAATSSDLPKAPA